MYSTLGPQPTGADSLLQGGGSAYRGGGQQDGFGGGKETGARDHGDHGGLIHHNKIYIISCI